MGASVLWNLTTMYSLASRRTALAPWWALGSGAISARWSPLRLSKIILVGPRKKDIGCDQQTKDKLLTPLKDSAHPIRAGAGSATRSATWSPPTTRPLGNSKGDEKTEN